MSPIFTLTDKYIRFSFKKGQGGKNNNKPTVHELEQISYLRLNLELEGLKTYLRSEHEK